MEEEGGRKVFDKQLKMVFANAMDDLQSAEDLYQLDGILKCGNLGCQKSFGDIESNAEFAHVIEQANKVFGRPSSAMPVLPDELRVWICLLDDTITEFFSNNQYILKLCSALLKLFLLGQLTVDSMESFRVITHNTIRLLAQAGSFMNPQNDQDSTILMKQIDFLNRTSLGGKMTVVDYRDVIEVFAHYWKQRNESIDGFLAKLPGNYFKRDVEEIQSLLLQCIAESLEKMVELADLKRFCLAFESLLCELHKLPLDCNGRELTELDQLKAAMGLMELAKFSVSYCNMQPEFTSFDRFLEKCTEPIASVSSESTSLVDLE
ncbi:hypothetical protein pipiens_020501, partial [Culex pipiens pipiens]